MSTKSQKQIVVGNSRIRKDVAAPEAKGKTSAAQSEIEALEEALRDLRGLSAALAEECEEEEEEGEENEDEEADEDEQEEKTSKIDGVGKKCQKLAKGDSKATKTNEKSSPLAVTASSSGASSSCSPSTQQQQDQQHSHRDVSSPPPALSARMSVSGILFAVLYCVTLLCLQNTNVRVPAPTTATTLHSLRGGEGAGDHPTSPIATADTGVDAANGLSHVGQSDTTSTTIRFTVCPVNLLSLPPQVVAAGRNGNANKNNNKIARVLDTTESAEDTKEALRLLPRYLVGLARRYLPFLSRVLLGGVGEAGQWPVATGGGRGVDELIIVSVPWLEPMTAVAIFCTALVCLFRFILVFADAAVIDATAKRSERMKQERAASAASSSSEGGKNNKKSAARKNEIVSAAAAAEEQSLVAHRVLTLRLVASSVVRCIVAAPLMAAQQALLIIFIIGALNNAAIRFDLTDRMLIMC